MPRYQGEFDGLCGPYAIVNAFEHCDYPNTELIFKTACSVFPKNRWPELLWKGTDIDDMRNMLRACERKLKFTPAISIKYPFETDTPKTNEDYWKCFDTVFADEAVICGIVGLTKPSLHWIVVSRDSAKRIMFHDSTVDRPSARKNRSSLYAGERRQTPNQWLINRQELITFSIG